MISQSPDTKTSVETPIRAPSAVPVDDAVLPFEVDTLDLRGRLTRLGPALDDVLTKHDYPRAVGKLLGEAIVLTTLLGSSLKFEGRFILQTQTDGPGLQNETALEFQRRAKQRRKHDRFAEQLADGARIVVLGEHVVERRTEPGQAAAQIERVDLEWQHRIVNGNCR